MRYLKVLLRLIACLLAAFALFIIAAWILEYRPEPEEVIAVNELTPAHLPDTLTILSWNTGYAGLGSDMDFFYDGGTQTRTSKTNTLENIARISEFISFSGADIILLQELDVSARRSYGTDQFAVYDSALSDYQGYFAYNYNSFYVPVPVLRPLGKVKAGLAVFSKIEPVKVARFQYPGGFPWPVRLFNLKRCLLAAEFPLRSGGSIMIGNTHNSAYDDGGMRDAEMRFLRDSLGAWRSSGIASITGGDWNQNPPGYIQSHAEATDRYFSPKVIDADFFPAGWEFAYDNENPSARYLYESWQPGATTTTTIDMFLTSPGVRCLEVKTHDLGFANSDHNPVTAIFVLE